MPIVLEPRVHEADGHRPLAYSRSHTFDRSAPNVYCGEHAGQAGLQQIRFVSGILPLTISRGAGCPVSTNPRSSGASFSPRLICATLALV